MELLFATQNAHKVKEVNEIISGIPNLKVFSLAEMGITDDIPETQDTIRGNAIQKAEYLWQKFGKNCFAEDSGLEVDALNGAPGVYSARYSGEPKNDKRNLEKVLKEMENKTKRSARFRTVIAFIYEGHLSCFEGLCEGTIRNETTGAGGFGYDPIFQPTGYDKTFGELPAEIKNKISHRAKAMSLFLTALKNI